MPPKEPRQSLSSVEMVSKNQHTIPAVTIAASATDIGICEIRQVADDTQLGRSGNGSLADRYEARASVGLAVSGFGALIGSAGGVSLNAGKADLGTSTAHPATMAAAHAVRATKTYTERALQYMTRLVGTTLPPCTFFNR